MKHMVIRTVAAAAIGAAGLLAAAGTAGAAPAPNMIGTPSPQDAVAAQQAAADPVVRDTLGRFFTQTGRLAPSVRPAVTIGSGSVPVYSLSRDFVAGLADAPVGTLAYQAVPVSASTGQTATLWTVRGRSGGWEVGNIASGDRETTLAAQLPAGSTLLHEPQVDAWYAAGPDGLRLLDAGVSKRPVGAVTSLADYQRLVKAAYGDKLPGSVYARQGAGGGYGVRAAQAGGGYSVQLPGAMSYGKPESSPASVSWLPYGLAAGAVVLVGIAAFSLRSARRKPSK